ncbi:amidohydrolase family protein [Nonomuraea rhodomycinica]|uniref:amidohydrolase family protein n=1 Tax=Nonomuraea rhodomycinica TaxID=1712872 RepID=UPI0028AFE8FA|nr:amidohydrolase family protein [Nonomuraea rhodomycinica]
MFSARSAGTATTEPKGNPPSCGTVTTSRACRPVLAVAKHAGVRIGLASDLIGPAQDRRGEELSLRAALETSMEAFVAATQTNAEILGLSGQVGVVTPGAQADLVPWNGDPLEDPEVFSDPTNAVLVNQAGQIVKDLR